MNFIRRNKFFEWIASLSLLWLAGCAAAISPEMLKDVDQSIPFEVILKDPEAFQGKTVLLGGDIIETENFPDKTLIIILQRPLDSKEKPSGEDKSKGRFIFSEIGVHPQSGGIIMAPNIPHSDPATVKTYGRYIPNLTRRDGSAFERQYMKAANEKRQPK